MAPPRWTGWRRSRSAASPSPLLRRPASGTSTRSTSSTPPGTSTSRSRSSASLRVLDGAVAVFDGKEGVEPQSETVWRQADKYDVPRICFVNKMDKLGADFYFTVDTIIKRLGAKPLVIQLPIGSESAFEGVVDLVEMRALTWRGDSKGDVEMGAKYAIEEIPADLVEKANEYRQVLLETVAETDDALLESSSTATPTSRSPRSRPPSASSPSPARSTRCSAAPRSRTAACSRCSMPSSTTCRRPLDVPAIEGHDVRDEEKVIERHADSTEPFAALAFKVCRSPVLRSPDLRPRLLGPASTPAARSSTRPRARRSASARSSRCTPTRRTRSTASPPATSTRSSASRTPPPVTPCPTRTTRSSSSR